MSDTPIPPQASGADPAPAPLAPLDSSPVQVLPPRPRRVDWRPKLRWFGAEYLIVVLGVLTAVGLNAWWQGRQDAAREQEYLRQLVEDLQQTETQLEHTERMLALKAASLGRLLRPYRSSSRPLGDSVLTWMGSLVFLPQPSFVTGTATALVETGDLNLIRNDSLRTAITSYLGRIDRQATNNVANYERLRDHLTALSGRVDMLEAILSTYPPGFSDSLARASPAWPVSAEAPERAFAPLDVEAFYRDREAYADLVNVMQRMYAVRLTTDQTLRGTVALREQIEAELNR